MGTPDGHLHNLIEDADRAIENYEEYIRKCASVSERMELDEMDDDFPTVNEQEDLEDFAREQYGWAMELVKDLLEKMTQS